GAEQRDGEEQQDQERASSRHCLSLRARRSGYSAASSRSPVRIRTAVSTGVTNHLPSPMEPVRAEAVIASTTLPTIPSGTTSSTLIFGRKSIVSPEPRYSSVCPFWRPKPRTSDTVIPMTPMSVSVALTSSSLKGLMIASIFFMAPPWLAEAGVQPKCHGERGGAPHGSPR